MDIANFYFSPEVTNRWWFLFSHTHKKNVLSPDYFLFFQVEHLIAVDDSYFLRMFSFFLTIFAHPTRSSLFFSLINATSRKSASQAPSCTSRKPLWVTIMAAPIRGCTNKVGFWHPPTAWSMCPLPAPSALLLYKPVTACFLSQTPLNPELLGAHSSMLPMDEVWGEDTVF